MALVADAMGPMATVEVDLISTHTNTNTESPLIPANIFQNRLEETVHIRVSTSPPPI